MQDFTRFLSSKAIINENMRVISKASALSLLSAVGTRQLVTGFDSAQSFF